MWSFDRFSLHCYIQGMKILQGISASVGIGIGSAFVVPEDEETAIMRRVISKEEILPQWENLKQAIEQVKRDISALVDKSNDEQNAIFETYMMMLDDTIFLEQVKKAHESSSVTIEHILYTHYQEYADSLRQTGDEYLKQRADDICDVYGRVIDVLIDRETFDMNLIPEGSIVVAKSFLPTDAVILSKKNLKAFVLEEGGVTSHFGILVRNYGIPAVFGIKDVTNFVNTNDLLIADGDEGVLYVNPDKKTINSFEKTSKEKEVQNKKLSSFKNKQAQTKDGKIINLFANIGTPEEAKIAQEEGANGIGLFRTEFLFMNEDRLLTEEEQFDVYRSVLLTMGDKSVTIRTLDAGADKIIPLSDCSDANEKNPLLGWRAVRFCLDHPVLFKTQIKALLRAGLFGNLKIMFPLISGNEELVQVLDLVEEAKKELTKKKVPFNKDVPLGIMIETASAAMISDILAKKSDFFSIGTNDLTQYSLGVDRDNTNVAHLFSEFHPAIIRMIAQTVKNAKENNISVSVCGEMAARPEGVAVLVGLGIENLSMGTKQLNVAKELLSRFTSKELADIAKKIQSYDSASEIKKKLASEIS